MLLLYPNSFILPTAISCSHIIMRSHSTTSSLSIKHKSTPLPAHTSFFVLHFPVFQRHTMPTARTHSSLASPIYAPTAISPMEIPNSHVPPTAKTNMKTAAITAGNTASPVSYTHLSSKYVSIFILKCFLSHHIF